MTGQSHALSRRYALSLLGVTTLAGWSHTAGAQSPAPLILRLAPRLLGWAGIAYLILQATSRETGTPAASPTPLPPRHAVEDAERALARQREQEEQARRAAELPYAMRLAKHLGVDLGLAQELVRAHGIDLIRRVVDDGLTVWPQRDHLGVRVLGLSLGNHSSQQITGAMHIAVDDLATNRREFSYRFQGYRLEPRGTLDIDLPFNADFPKPGLKRIAIEYQHYSVVTRPAEVLVIPVELKRS